jgi:hypothetical protein
MVCIKVKPEVIYVVSMFHTCEKKETEAFLKQCTISGVSKLFEAQATLGKSALSTGWIK